MARSRAAQTIRTNTRTKGTRTVLVTSGKPRSGTQSRCPTCGKYMRRLAQMEQQYPQFAQQPMGQGFTQQQAPVYMKCRAVTSIDEAKAAMIDLDGSLHVFTDIPHRKIYTKQINLDGTASLNVYSLDETPTPVQTGATATFNITQDGEQIAGAKIVSSIAAAGVNNVSCTTLVRVYCSDVSSVSVTNIGATAIDVSDANMTITRLC